MNLLALWAVYRTGTLPVGLQGRSALPVGDSHGSGILPPLCAQLPEPDCKSGRVAHKVWRPLGRKTRLPRMRHGFPGNITNGLWEVYMRFTAPARCRSGCKGEAPLPGGDSHGSGTLPPLCAQLPEVRLKIRPRGAQGLEAKGRKTRSPSKRQAPRRDRPPKTVSAAGNTVIRHAPRCEDYFLITKVLRRIEKT